MWTGQQLGDSMDLPGFIGALVLGGVILAVYTGSLAYVGAKTGLSLDLLAQHSFGAKGSYPGFIGALVLGGVILAVYTGSLAYVGAKTGLSLDLLAQHSFGAKGSYLPSILISFTQIGWFGVGVAMFAIPVAKLIDPENVWLPYVLVLVAGACMMASAFFGIKAMTIGVGVAMFAIPVAKLIDPENVWLPYVLVLVAGACMMASAFFGIKAMTIVSYVSVPLIAILGITAMVMAVRTGDVPLAEKFAESQGMSVITGAGLVIGSFVSGLIAILGITAMVMAVRTGDVPLAEKFAESQGMSVITGAGLVIGSFVSGGTATPNFARFARNAVQSVIVTVVAFLIGGHRDGRCLFDRKQPDVLFRGIQRRLCRRK